MDHLPEGLGLSVAERKAISEKRLSLEERAQTFHTRVVEFRHTFMFPTDIPKSYYDLLKTLGTYTYHGPGLSGTNAPHKYLEEYTTEEIGETDRKEILDKLEYADERKSFSARLDRARTLEELTEIEHGLEELEAAFAELERQYENKAA
jgi:hypothetical protein